MRHLSGDSFHSFPLASFVLCLFHRLSPSHWEAVFLISGSRQWSGDRVVHHVRLASLPYYPEMCGRLQNPVKCQRGSLYNLSVQTLPQDTAAVFFFFPSCSATKKENKGEGLLFTPRSSLAAVGFWFLTDKVLHMWGCDRSDCRWLGIRRRGKYHEETTDSNVSQPHRAGAAANRQIPPVGGEYRSGVDYCSIA